MGWLIEKWKAFWFRPSAATNLGVCRFLFFGVLLYLYFGKDSSAWADVPGIFWMPIRLFQIPRLPVFSAGMFAILDSTWKVALGLSCIGLFTRTSMISSFILGAYLLGIPQNFGKVHHSDALVVLIMGIMAFSRAGDGWSVDRLIRTARRGGDPSPTDPVVSGEYTWPVRLVWVLFALVFFGAGVSKIRHSGLEWIASNNMALILVRHHYTHHPLTSWGLWLAQYRWVSSLLAGWTVVTEVGMPLALFSRRMRLILLPSVFLMQFGIWILMGVSFRPFLACYLFWIPWDRVGGWFAMRTESKQKYAVLYDGACGLCQATTRVISDLDLSGRVALYDAENDWAHIERRFAGLSKDACLKDMHVVTATGQVCMGFDAYRALGWVLPLAWLALPVLYLPGIPAIGRRIYRSVASRRHRGSCQLSRRSGASTLGLPDQMSPGRRNRLGR